MEKLDVFKCSKCGNIVEVMHVGGGVLSCCSEPMKQKPFKKIKKIIDQEIINFD